MERMCAIRISGEKYAEPGMRSRTRETRPVADGNNGCSVARETPVSTKCRNVVLHRQGSFSEGRTLRTGSEGEVFEPSAASSMVAVIAANVD